MSVNIALKRCAKVYNRNLKVTSAVEEREVPSRTKVDMAIYVNDVRRILLEAKSPTVMEHIRDILPLYDMDLKWEQGGTTLMKVFLKVNPYPSITPSSLIKKDG